MMSIMFSGMPLSWKLFLINDKPLGKDCSVCVELPGRMGGRENLEAESKEELSTSWLTSGTKLELATLDTLGCPWPNRSAPS